MLVMKRRHLLLCLMSSGFLFVGCKSSSSNSAAKAEEVSTAPASGFKLHALEQTHPNEDAMIQGIAASIAKSVTTNRDAHPKAHACVYNAQVQINPDLDVGLRKGVFATPGKTYEAIMRFSSGSSNPKANDTERGSQGLAMKILLDPEQQSTVEDIPGEVQHTPPNAPAFATPRTARDFYKTFDIISIDGLSEFVVDDLATYGAFFKAAPQVGPAVKAAIGAAMAEAKKAGKTLTKEEIGKIAATTALGVWRSQYTSKIPTENQAIIEGLLLKLMAVKPENLLSERYNSWVPYAFDETNAVKYSFIPCTDLSGSKAVALEENFYRTQLRADLDSLAAKGRSGCFELVAQFHDASMPSVEHASHAWGPEASRKYTKLATVRVPNTVTDPTFCEALSFNPAHALPNQRGIGATQRARRIIYATISNKRTTTVEGH